MPTYKRMKSTLNKNDKKYLVNLEEWAHLTLEYQDYVDFCEDSRLYTIYHVDKQMSGELKIENIVDTVTENNENIDVVIGILYTIDENFTRDPRELKWLERMAKDPNVVFVDDELVKEE